VFSLLYFITLNLSKGANITGFIAGSEVTGLAVEIKPSPISLCNLLVETPAL
jgi:hypothetical protein